ncbi:restriction endonuclease subunit S [Oceanimonas baumannii]|uniref:restriction endonuclease subunit S n=1 Tax=Oceanimonas baumannii TaxID=129578 RepID=UPI001D18CFCA|nr:restriction endonuclease subunit S [Oceanimonas baumannii]MCC4265171.1 restriction endonuclease subunit S [Oceanimonas baumannii]
MVPNGWEETRLKHIARIKSGSTPLRAKQDLYYSQDGTPWVKTLDLNNAEIFETDERITELALKETSCSIFPVNTVLVAMYGGFNQIGRTGLLTVPSAINQALSGLMLDDTKADSKYILNYLNGNILQWKKFAASSRKDPNITREDVCNFKVLLPPLPEQQKIAQILSTWDRGIATTEKLIDASKQQKKALMQQLLTGKKRLVDPETGKAFEGEWETEQFDKLFNIEIGGTPSRSNETYWDDKLETNNNWLSIADLKGKFISRTKERISDLGVAKSNVSLIPKGTIVMSFKLTIGRRAFLNIDTYTNEAICALLIKNKDKLDNNYLYQALEIVDFEQEIDQAVKGKTLNKAKLKRLKLSMPSVKEQQKIASVLTSADKDIELLEAKLLHFKQEKKALMQQLLTGKRRVKVAETEAA